MRSLATTISRLQLVAPHPTRDAAFAVRWFQGEEGKTTLLKMGNPDSYITLTSLDKEIQILNEFVELAKNGTQLTWMIRMDERTVGAVWVELEASRHLPAPAVSIMIGDVSARGKGVGSATIDSVIRYMLENTHYDYLYARHLTSNEQSAGLLTKKGFEKLDGPYMDEEGLEFQNERLTLRTS